MFTRGSLFYSKFIHLSEKRLPERLLRNDISHSNFTKLFNFKPRSFRTRPSIQDSGLQQSKFLSQLGKPLAFTVTFSSSCIVGSAIWDYESFKKKKEHMLKSALSIFHSTHKSSAEQSKNQFLSYWEVQPEWKKVLFSICGPCLLVTILGSLTSRNPNLTRLFNKYFITLPNSSSPSCAPLVLSAFCHLSYIHLFVNMFALSSFLPVSQMGKEQLVGLYLTGAVLSSFGSLAFRVSTRSSFGSCGASGAILAVVAMCIMNNPAAQVSIIFLPMFQFPAGTALASIVALDFFGILMRWKFLDHAGHLAGVLTGLAWHQLWPTQQRYSVELWEKLKPRY